MGRSRAGGMVQHRALAQGGSLNEYAPQRLMCLNVRSTVGELFRKGQGVLL